MKKLLGVFLMMLVFLIFFHFQVTAFAQDAVSEPANQESAQANVIVPSGGEKAESILKDFNSKLPTSFPPIAIGVFTFAVEMFLRFKPTAKPKSLLLLIASIFGLIGAIFMKLSGLADNLIQNVKDQPPQ